MEETYNALLFFVQYKCTNNWPFGFYKFMISNTNVKVPTDVKQIYVLKK